MKIHRNKIFGNPSIRKLIIRHNEIANPFSDSVHIIPHFAGVKPSSPLLDKWNRDIAIAKTMQLTIIPNSIHLFVFMVYEVVVGVVELDQLCEKSFLTTLQTCFLFSFCFKLIICFFHFVALNTEAIILRLF
jgi:hypothetical protein